MDAFTVAARLLGGRLPTAEQSAQLRAINVRYYTTLFALLHSPPLLPGQPLPSVAPADAQPAERALTDHERTALEDRLTRDVEAVFAPAARPGAPPVPA